MFDLSIPKLLVLAVIALVVFGPKELPKIASQAGRALRDLRRIAEGAKNDLREGLGPEFADFEIEDLNPARFAQKHLFGDFNGSLPGVNTQVKVEANANPDGSFAATKIGNVDSSDDPNQVQFQGVTTQAVGSDRVIHFTVGNKSFSFPIASAADLSDYNGNAQSIASGASVKVTVEFSGTSGSATDIGSSNNQ